MEKFENNQHSRNNYLRQSSAERPFSKHSASNIYELQWTLRPYDLYSHRRVSTFRLQNGQGQACTLSGLARSTKALLW
jgi:hypothetical protein